MAQHIKLFSVSHENQDYITFITKHPKLDQLEDDKVLEAMINEWIQENPNAEVLFPLGPNDTGNRLYMYLWYEDNIGKQKSDKDVSRETSSSAPTDLKGPKLRPQRKRT